MFEQKEFFFLPIIKENKNTLYQTDNENYVLARDNIKSPIWIWTKKNITKEKIKEIIIILQDIINTNSTITCREELFSELKKVYETSNTIKIAYLECNRVKDVKQSNGFMDKPSYSDKTQLAHFWQDYGKELVEPKNISFIDSLKEIESWLEDDCFYVWRENNGKIVCMANYWENNGIAKISYVYTPKEQRNKGYCKSLIHELTKLLLDNHIEPMLYTDNSNIPANEVYKKIGYEQKEILFRFDKT